MENRAAHVGEDRRARIGAAGQPENVGAQVGQNHAREGHRTQAVELDDAHARQWFHGRCLA